MWYTESPEEGDPSSGTAVTVGLWVPGEQPVL